MNRFAFRRLWVALMVLSFLAGLPMQGIAMTSQMPMAASDELPTPGGATCCSDAPANVSCPVLFCLTLSVVAFEPTEFTRIPSEETWFSRQDAVVGLAFGPEPHPPRTSIRN